MYNKPIGHTATMRALKILTNQTYKGNSPDKLVSSESCASELESAIKAFL